MYKSQRFQRRRKSIIVKWYIDPINGQESVERRIPVGANQDADKLCDRYDADADRNHFFTVERA